MSDESASPSAATSAAFEAPRPASARRSLRWQLGISYMRVTFFAVLALEAIVLLLAAQSVLYAAGRNHAAVADSLGPIAGRLLAGRATPAALEAYLDRPLPGSEAARSIAFMLPHPPQGWTVVTGPDGSIWFDNRRRDEPLGRHARKLVDDVLARGDGRIGREPLRSLRATPVRAPDGGQVGVLLQVSTLPQAGPGLLTLALAGLLVGTLLVVSLGTSFGLIASRSLTRRIERLVDAADAWSRGDLTRSVDDLGDDELGRLSRRLDRMAREVAELVHERQLYATREERTRIARELHDSVKQQLFAASMRLGAARIVPPSEADTQLESVARLLDEAKDELNHLIHELRPTAVAGREIEDALKSLVSRYEEGAGPAYELRVDTGIRASPSLSAALYRIVQEAVSNALRHASASRIDIELRVVDRSVELRVEDDGRGFDAAPVRRGVGLASMRERATRLGGSISVESNADGGTTVLATIPMREQDTTDVATMMQQLGLDERRDT